MENLIRRYLNSLIRIKECGYMGLPEGMIERIEFEINSLKDSLGDSLKVDDGKMMYDESFGYVSSPNSVAYMVAREGYMRKMKERERILKSVRENPQSFVNFDYIWRNDKEVVLEATIMDGLLLEYASCDLRDDEEVVKCAVNSNLEAIEFASNRIKDDDSIMSTLVSKCGLLIRFASPRIKKNKDIALLAVMNDGRAIYYIDDTLKSDRDVVLSAIRQDGSLILKASKDYLSDKEAVIAAVSQKSKSYLLMAVDEKFLDDIDVILSAYIYDRNAIKYAGDLAKDYLRIIIMKAAGDSLFNDLNVHNTKVKKL